MNLTFSWNPPTLKRMFIRGRRGGAGQEVGCEGEEQGWERLCEEIERQRLRTEHLLGFTGVSWPDPSSAARSRLIYKGEVLQGGQRGERE